MEYVLLVIVFILILYITWQTIVEESKISLSDISDNALIDYNNAQDIILTMIKFSKSGKKSAKFKISYPSQKAYMKNIGCIKKMIEENFIDDIKIDVEAIEYKGTVEATIVTSWE